jgi:uncharacterized protein (DUF433 family)
MASPHPTPLSAITTNPAIHDGEPILTGTATPVRAIAELWNQGMAAEEIPVHLSHLKLHQVFAALAYYLDHRDEVDKSILANRIPEDLVGKKFDPVARIYVRIRR